MVDPVRLQISLVWILLSVRENIFFFRENLGNIITKDYITDSNIVPVDQGYFMQGGQRGDGHWRDWIVIGKEGLRVIGDWVDSCVECE